MIITVILIISVLEICGTINYRINARHQHVKCHYHCNSLINLEQRLEHTLFVGGGAVFGLFLHLHD